MEHPMPGLPTPPPLVAVVVLNWNKAAMTASCIAAVARMTYPRLLTLVVDNGSDPGSLGPLEQSDTPFELIRNPRNLGFTGGVNIGIRRALETDAAYIWLLNNDALPEADTLSHMIPILEADRGIGMASPVVRNSDAHDAEDFCGGLWNGQTTETTADLAIYQQWQRDAPERIWLVGTALLMRRQLVEAIGLYDERFFAYWEDTDYSLRALAAGYRNIVVAGAVVRHAAGALAADPRSKPPHFYYYMARNELLFTRKHLGWWAGRRPLWWAVRRQLALVSLLAGDRAKIEAVLGGLFDGLTFHRGEFNPRRRLATPLRWLLLAASRGVARGG
jgi:GT2 family glycosyltransferase